MNTFIYTFESNDLFSDPRFQNNLNDFNPINATASGYININNIVISGIEAGSTFDNLIQVQLILRLMRY